MPHLSGFVSQKTLTSPLVSSGPEQPPRRIGDKTIISRLDTTFRRFTMHSSIKSINTPPIDVTCATNLPSKEVAQRRSPEGTYSITVRSTHSCEKTGHREYTMIGAADRDACPPDLALVRWT